jgi:hypothetical protein
MQTIPQTYFPATATTSSRRRKYTLNARKILWKAIRSWIAAGSIPCWALPYEAIAAAMLLRDRERRPRKKTEEK